jgi:two-component system, LuxR family, response regulator FixJ
MNTAISGDELTPRESAVLALIIQGATSRAAGTLLGISRRTVEFHRANIMEKLSAKNVADLVRIVLDRE